MAYKNCNINTRTYKHLTYKERVKIEIMLKSGYKMAEIARELGRSKSTIKNEILRGTTTQIKQNKLIEMYLADTGQTIYDRNRERSKKPYKALICSEYLDFVVDKFKNRKWSLDACYGYAVKNKLFENVVSTKTLYNYIDIGLIPISVTDLPEKLGRNTKKVKIRKNKKSLGNSIENRPDISSRDTFGHWEIDTVQGVKSKDEPVLLTIIERQTRQYIAIKIKAKTSEAVAEGFNVLFNEYKERFSEVFKTITSDNGSEFATLNNILKGYGTKVYFTHPYSSYERGSNERHNGMIRRFIPKGTSIKIFTQDQISSICDWLNNLPRKILSYKTPERLFDLALDKIYAL